MHCGLPLPNTRDKNTLRLLNGVWSSLTSLSVLPYCWRQMDQKMGNNAHITYLHNFKRWISFSNVGRSVCQSCWADDQTFVRSVLFCGNDNQIFVWLSGGADAQIFVWSVLWGWCPDFCLVCLVERMPRFLSGLSCAAEDHIFVWSVLCGWGPDFCPVSAVLCGWRPYFSLVCLVRLMIRFLSGQSCLVRLNTIFLSGLSCAAEDHIFVWSVLCGWRPYFCLVCLVRLRTRFLPSLVLWRWYPDFCSVSFVGLMTRSLSGQSCPVALISRFMSDQSCLVVMITKFFTGQSACRADQIFFCLSCEVTDQDFYLVSCLVALITRFLSGQSCPVALLTRFLFGVSCGLMTRFLPTFWIMLSYCRGASSLASAEGPSVVVCHRLCHKHLSTYFQIRWSSCRTLRHLK